MWRSLNFWSSWNAEWEEAKNKSVFFICVNIWYFEETNRNVLLTVHLCLLLAQRRLSVYSKMQECYEQQQQQQQMGGRAMPSRDQAALGAAAARRSTPDSEQKDGAQPTETEYLGSRCVLFTYFQGEIGDVVDEHFSRALSQSSNFSGDAKQIRVAQPSASNGSWKGEFSDFTFRSSHYPSPFFCFEW